MNDATFDYEAKIWGAPKVRLGPTHMQALKLRYCLEDLKDISGRVLDIGCGAGNMPKAIKHYRPDLEVWGADLSYQAIKVAKQTDDGAKFVPGAGEHLPFEDGFFDAVTMFDVLEHFPEPGVTLAEIRRVVRTSGIFHLFLPLEKQPYTIYALLYRLGWKAKEEHCGHVQFYSDEQGRQDLKDAGFEVASTRWSVHPIYAMVDVAYFTMLSMRGKPISTSVEGFINGNNGKPTMAQRLVGTLKNAVVVMGYYESRALRMLPGGGGHYAAVRR